MTMRNGVLSEKYSLIENGEPPQPVWKPKWRYGGDRYRFDSPKMQREIVTISPHEHHHCLVLECDPLVLSYCEYPIVISIRDAAGKKIKTKPDAWVLLVPSREQIREVKTEKKFIKSSRQIEAQHFWCAMASIEHRVIIAEKHLPEILVKNCERIVPYLKHSSDPDKQKQVLDLIDQLNEIPLDELRCSNRVETQQRYTAALQLLCSGRLTADLHNQYFSNLKLRRWENAEPCLPLC